MIKQGEQAIPIERLKMDSNLEPSCQNVTNVETLDKTRIVPVRRSTHVAATESCSRLNNQSYAKCRYVNKCINMCQLLMHIWTVHSVFAEVPLGSLINILSMTTISYELIILPATLLGPALFCSHPHGNYQNRLIWCEGSRYCSNKRQAYLIV